MKNVNSDADPRMNQRDPSKEFNQLRPRSTASSGMELDEGCEITQAEGGKGLDHAIKIVDADLPPQMSSAGEQQATKSGEFVGWKDTKAFESAKATLAEFGKVEAQLRSEIAGQPFYDPMLGLEVR